ncbi:MAG: peptidase and DD-carboxypeptidase VanY/endolysin [Parcubacteria group bacterium]|nr:peptidase and DD-carboxypeptidase VanY/endolysin [Parcubacteria group bacterium]
MNSSPHRIGIAFGVLGILFVATVAFATYDHLQNTRALSVTRADLASTTATYEEQVATQEKTLQDAQAQNQALSSSLASERQKNGDYQSQVGDLTSTVGILTKLTTIDPQLLAKYSKVYFLNENYSPAKLATITPEETYDHARIYKFEGDALPFLDSMMRDARTASTSPLVVSAYRSFSEQSSLKASYKVTYGAGTANSFSADQGYSEHQLGTAIDFTTDTLGANFTIFDKTTTYVWLTQNAYKYGFVISYPKANKFYTYEPWHWRFVGVSLATYLHDHNQYFYDLDQRTINGYLVNLFDR